MRCTALGSSDEGVLAGDEFGLETLAVDNKLAAIVSRMCDSVLSVDVTTQAGHPLVRHQSSSSVMKHWRHRNAPRASPANASSRSSLFCVQRAAEARAEAREKSATTGMISAWRMSRWSRIVSLASESHSEWLLQKLGILVSYLYSIYTALGARYQSTWRLRQTIREW